MQNLKICAFLVLCLTSRYGGVWCDAKSKPTGIFEQIIENIRLGLRDVYQEHIDFDTQKQEFGRIKGALDKVKVFGLDEFEILEFRHTLIPFQINNLTARIPKFTVTGKYDMDGTLVFPTGNEPLHVFGNGDMTIKFGPAYPFTKMTLGTRGGVKIVKDLDVSFNITTMDVKMTNLMGGGVMEDTFNKYFSEIGPILYEYYKPVLMGELRKPLIDALNKFLKDL